MSPSRQPPLPRPGYFSPLYKDSPYTDWIFYRAFLYLSEWLCLATKEKYEYQAKGSAAAKNDSVR